ncbi:MAG: molybdopterin-synthase adenylyltransferase MoeB [Nitrococcus sp.]|nr:molybdopterin-synthase adenylyltransferase MoeB [Nitrococcus sp.]
MNDDQLLRYSRQIMLPGLDIEGQEKLQEARVLIVGLGGLGSPAAMYLAGAGIGTLVLADFDRVELSNLQRQIIHRSADIGRLKVESAADAIRALNPEVSVESFTQPLDPDNLPALVEAVDLVVDGSDNFTTRYAVNGACVTARRPLISGSVIRMEGQVAVFRADRDDEPCYHCVYPDAGEAGETCSETGVIAPLPGVIGSIQAVEAMKVLLGLGQPLDSRLLVVNALNMQFRILRLRSDPRCPVCSSHGRATAVNGQEPIARGGF